MTNEQERAAFFAWVADCGCDTDGAWSAWQARAALASQAWQEPVARMLTVAETDSIAEEMEDWLRFDVVEAVIRKFCDVNAIPLAAPLAAGEPHTDGVPACEPLKTHCARCNNNNDKCPDGVKTVDGGQQ